MTILNLYEEVLGKATEAHLQSCEYLFKIRYLMWEKGVQLVDNDAFDLVMQTDANDITLPFVPDQPAVPYASVVEAVFNTAEGATPFAG